MAKEKPTKKRIITKKAAEDAKTKRKDAARMEAAKKRREKIKKFRNMGAPFEKWLV